jgi:competence CoiA-like predicted nuclease
MLWAIKDGEKINASPNEIAVCPVCNTEVIGKCGSIKEWHWAHKSTKDCDDWAEPESEWHLKWKSYFSKEQQEVVIKNHRADIKNFRGTVIELQNSNLSSEKIIERENFYGNMIWLLNGIKLCSGLKLRKNKNEIITFRWKNPPKSWWYSKKPIYIDLNFIPVEGIRIIESKFFTEEQKEFWKDLINKIFIIKKVYNNIPCGGWGYLITKEEFLNIVGGKYEQSTDY